MEKPRKVYWAKRNGFDALVLWRVAVPEYFAMIVIVLGGMALFVAMVAGLMLQIWWMAIPGLSIVGAFVLWFVWLVVRLIVRDFITVNRKNLNGKA